MRFAWQTARLWMLVTACLCSSCKRETPKPPAAPQSQSSAASSRPIDPSLGNPALKYLNEMSSITSGGWEKRARSGVGLLVSAIEAFRLEASRYPTEQEQFRPLLSKPEDVIFWKGPYATEDSLIDPWGAKYHYKIPGVHNPKSFDVWSDGADHKSGTDDDIGNWKIATSQPAMR